METSDDQPDDEIRPEYDLSQLRRVPGGRRRLERIEKTSEFPDEDEPGDTRMKLTPPQTRDFIARMDAAMMPLLNKCVVAIYGDHNGIAVQCGTGTLFRVADYSFLVSACHVTNLARKGVQLYVSDAGPKAPGVALEGNLHSEKNLDVSVWQLAPQVISELPNRKFLTIHQTDRADLRVNRGWYYVHGYPNCWSHLRPDEQKTTVKAFTYGTVLYQGDTSTFEGYNPDLHVLLTAPKKGNVDSHGAQTEMPTSLKGISGCSIWQAYYEGLPSRSWTSDDAVVVAVQTGVYRGGTVVRGTRWWIIEKILSKNYPDLEGPLSLMTPSMRKPSAS
ncbi:MAG: hypothetical protein V4719_24800 [Planctomycetota bacterium]